VRKICLWLAVFILTAAGGCSRPPIRDGDKFPRMVFYDAVGKKVGIYDYAGPDRLLLIHFWGAACCMTYSEPTIRAVAGVHAGREFDNVAVVSVNLDYKESRVRRIRQKMGPGHPLFNDRDGCFYKAYPKLRYFFPMSLILLVDEEGIIRGHIMGPQLLPAISDLIRRSQIPRGDKS